ncbi:hypothetical protein [Planctomicrobium sp. SH527]|uniref:hypothetical protein n=1 Tax=Planctomicrobium sp. SH527 TaxID=3448123 RepID=UPI003F5BE65C
MSRLFVGNFSFEQAQDAGFSPSRSIARFEAELGCIWLAMTNPDDEILSACPFPDDYLNTMKSLGCRLPRIVSPDALQDSQATEIVPWGWTPAVRKLAQRLDIAIQAPPQEIVWQVNSRIFSHEISTELQCALPGEAIVTSLPELMPVIQKNYQQSGGWVLKPNLGQAGRGQIRGNSPFLTEGQFGTVLHMLSRGGSVVVEPLLRRHFEVGCQWEITPPDETGASQINLLGMTRLLTDEQGRYRGNCLIGVEINQAARENILSVQRSAVERIAETGYFGPVGIDAMLYWNEENLAVRPVQDINARWTMGRMTLEWAKRLGAFNTDSNKTLGGWYHADQPPAADAIPLSPAELDQIPVRCRTWWSTATPVE